MTALDTNVLIYACDKSDPRRQQIELELIATVTDGVLLWQVACEFVAPWSRPGSWRNSGGGGNLFPIRLAAGAGPASSTGPQGDVA